MEMLGAKVAVEEGSAFGYADPSVPWLKLDKWRNLCPVLYVVLGTSFTR